MVHCGMLPRPPRHLDDREGCRSAQGAPQGSRAAGGGRHERKLVGARGRPEGGGYRGDIGDGETQVHAGALPPATAPLVPGQEDVEYAVKGGGVWSRTDYIMGTDRRLFGNVSIRDPRQNSDHYLVLGFLHSASLKKHMRYLGGRKKLPLQLPTDPTREDDIFAALRRVVPTARVQEARRNEWIPERRYSIVDEYPRCRRDPFVSPGLLHPRFRNDPP